MKIYWDKEKMETEINSFGGSYPLRLVLGGNRLGKTWSGIKMSCETILNEDNVLWMRMFDEEFKGEFIENFMNVMVTLEPSLSISYEKDDGGRLTKCEGGIKLDGVQRIYFRSLNVFGKARGNGSTTGKLKLGILDEFIPEDGRVPSKGIYVPMMALIRTFSNYDDDFVCYCLANCITPLSDLFASTQCFPKRQYDVTLYPDKGVAIEVCRGYQGAIPQNGVWSKVVNAGKMRGYKEFEGMYIEDFIIQPKRPIVTKTSLKYSEHEYLVLHNDGDLQVWTICSKPPTGGIVLSNDGDIKCTFLDGKIKKEIRNMFFSGRYRFNSYNSLSRFLTVIEITLS